MSLGPQELVLALVVLILLFGAKRLPELANAMGRSIKEFRRASEDDAENREGT